jgi:cytochrome c-type biogenesis protein CcmE
MKKIYIVSLVLVVAAIVIIVQATGDYTTYADFAIAEKTGERVKITGQLVKEKEMIYNPDTEPNIFRFFMEDVKGEQRQIVLNKAKPQDFELSESIVLTGQMKGDAFYADEILMKCPSKYKEEEIYTKSDY